MKKLLAIAVLAFAAFGVAGAAHAAECSAPVSVDCDTTDANGNPIHCTLFVDAGTDLDGCYNV